MSETSSYKVENPQGKELWIACASCNRTNCHAVLASVSTTDGNEDCAVYEEYCIVICNGCKTVSFCQISQNSESIEYDERTGEERLSSSYAFFPSRIAGRALLSECYSLPHGVYRIYQEAHRALCEGLNVSAGFGIRAIVEAVCKEKGVVGHDLKQKIDGLQLQGVVTADGAKILHSLRFLGNRAVHEMKAHTHEELCAGFDVVEYLLRGVFILPKQAAKLPQPGSPPAPLATSSV